MMMKPHIVGKLAPARSPRHIARSAGMASLCLALGAGLLGCGQRGPLYLPTDPPATSASPSPSSPRP